MSSPSLPIVPHTNLIILFIFLADTSLRQKSDGAPESYQAGIWCYLNIELQDCKASVVGLHFFVIWITVLLLVLWRITRRTLVSGNSTTRLVVGVISAMVENGLGESNLALTSWSTWTKTWRRKGLLPAMSPAWAPLPAARCRGTTTSALPAAEGPPPRHCPLPTAGGGGA